MQNHEPKLQAPGAGLPLFQRIALRYLIGPLRSKNTPWEESRAIYEKITNRILTTVEAIPAEKRKTKILVKPIMGLEDSSRYWSVDMLLEHLLIVGKAMEGTILQLSQGIEVNVVVNTAKVKPTEASVTKTSEEILAEYKAFAPHLMQRLDAGMKNRDSHLTLKHPWFGPFTARQWYWVLAGHQGIHWQQLKLIRAQL